MINIVHRFHGHGSLRYVYQNGRTVRGPLCSIKYAVNKHRKQYRLAIVVSKKVAKSAVKRNRIRRRLYEQFRLAEPEIDQPYDMVLTVFHEQLASLPPDELKQLVRAQLRQAKIIPAKTTPVHAKIKPEGE